MHTIPAVVVLFLFPLVIFESFSCILYWNRRWSCWQKLTNQGALSTTMWRSWALCSPARQQVWSASRLAWQDSSIVSRNRRYSAGRRFLVSWPWVPHSPFSSCYYHFVSSFCSQMVHPPVIFSFLMLLLTSLVIKIWFIYTIERESDFRKASMSSTSVLLHNNMLHMEDECELELTTEAVVSWVRWSLPLFVRGFWVF